MLSYCSGVNRIVTRMSLLFFNRCVPFFMLKVGFGLLPKIPGQGPGMCRPTTSDRRSACPTERWDFAPSEPRLSLGGIVPAPVTALFWGRWSGCLRFLLTEGTCPPLMLKAAHRALRRLLWQGRGQGGKVYQRLPAYPLERSGPWTLSGFSNSAYQRSPFRMAFTPRFCFAIFNVRSEIP